MKEIKYEYIVSETTPEGEPQLYTVGYYDLNNNNRVFVPSKDALTKEEAQAYVDYLNTGSIRPLITCFEHFMEGVLKEDEAAKGQHYWLAMRVYDQFLNLFGWMEEE